MPLPYSDVVLVLFKERERICKICFENVVDSTDICSDSEPARLRVLWNKITECFRINIDTDGEKYFGFCKRCAADLDTACRFRRKCETIQERFKDYCKEMNKTQFNTPIEQGDGTTLMSEHNQSEIDSTEILSACVKEKYVCDTCNKILKTKKSLLKHIISMHEKQRHTGKVSGFGSARRYHCTTCSYSTPHSQTLLNHMRRHNGERPFKCECGKSFTQASSLAAHHKTHSPTSLFTCAECGKQFKHAFSLKTHMLVHRTGTYSCHICNKLLKSKRSLTSHLHRHFKIYNYSCENCGDTFVTSAELHNHKMKHNTKKDVVCHICDYATSSKKNLLVHLKRHQGEKAFKCIFCAKAFLTEGNMRRHLRVHTREKPFSCQICSQRFAHSSSLNNHMLTFHGVKYRWGDKLKESKSRVVKTGRDYL